MWICRELIPLRARLLQKEQIRGLHEQNPSVESENIKRMVLSEKIGEARWLPKMELHHTKFKESNLVLFPFGAYSTRHNVNLENKLSACGKGDGFVAYNDIRYFRALQQYIHHMQHYFAKRTRYPRV
jgi:hypothetical protein